MAGHARAQLRGGTPIPKDNHALAALVNLYSILSIVLVKRFRKHNNTGEPLEMHCTVAYAVHQAIPC